MHIFEQVLHLFSGKLRTQFATLRRELQVDQIQPDRYERNNTRTSCSRNVNLFFPTLLGADILDWTVQQLQMSVFLVCIPPYLLRFLTAAACIEHSHFRPVPVRCRAATTLIPATVTRRQLVTLPTYAAPIHLSRLVFA